MKLGWCKIFVSGYGFVLSQLVFSFLSFIVVNWQTFTGKGTRKEVRSQFGRERRLGPLCAHNEVTTKPVAASVPVDFVGEFSHGPVIVPLQAVRTCILR